MKILAVLTILFQLILSFMVLIGIYLVYAVSDMIEIDLVATIGFLLFQPILGVVFTLLTILLCLILGLPIRMIRVVNQFWKTKPIIPIIGTVTGFIFLFLSFLNRNIEIKEVIVENKKVIREVPNLAMSMTGWLLIAFCLLHFYPQSLLKYLHQLISKNKEAYNLLLNSNQDHHF